MSTFKIKDENGNWKELAKKTTGTVLAGQAVSTAATGYGDFAFKCDIAVQGVTASNYCVLTFGANDSVAGKLAPFCETGTDKITIFASESYTTVDALTYMIV